MFPRAVNSLSLSPLFHVSKATCLSILCSLAEHAFSSDLTSLEKKEYLVPAYCKSSFVPAMTQPYGFPYLDKTWAKTPPVAFTHNHLSTPEVNILATYM